MLKKTVLCFGPVLAVMLMASLALAQPPVRQVPGQQPAQPDPAAQQQVMQMQQQQQQAPQLRQVGQPDMQAPQQRIQRSLPVQGQPGQGGQVMMMQQQQMIAPGMRWYLGVNEQWAPLGVRVASVSWNTPAQYLGLEAGDFIMDVMGYPVGWYQDSSGFRNYYPLGSALDMYTRPDGWCNLMIWNVRTGQQMPFWVRLNPR